MREFFPKSKDLRKVGPREVKRVEELLNTRPRRVLDYRTPAEVFCEALEAVGVKTSVVSELCSWRE